MAALWRDRWAWLGYGVLEILALYNYYEYYYHSAIKPTLAELTHYLWIALIETFTPALLGIRNAGAPSGVHAGAIVAALLAVSSGVALTLYLRPRAWRCLVAFLVVFAITMLPVGLNRISQFGVNIGYELHYQQSVQFMFWVLAAFALSSRWGGQRAQDDKVRSWLAAHQPSRAILAVAGTAAIAGYGVFYIRSVDAMAKRAWEPRQARAYVNAFLADVDRIRRLTGREPDLIDHEVPGNIQFPSFAPFNRYDQFFGIFDSRLRIDEIASTAYFVNSMGQLLPVRFTSSGSGILRTATVSEPDGSDVIPASSSSGAPACVPDGWTVARLHIKLSAPQAMARQPTGLPYALRVYFRMRARAPVPLLLANAKSITVDNGFPHVWGPGRGGELAPLSVRMPVDEVAFELPGGACVGGLAFGEFSLAGPPVR
jgi:hypothetical protein